MMIGPDSAMIFALGWTTVLAPMVMSPKIKKSSKKLTVIWIRIQNKSRIQNQRRNAIQEERKPELTNTQSKEISSFEEQDVFS